MPLASARSCAALRAMPMDPISMTANSMAAVITAEYGLRVAGNE